MNNLEHRWWSDWSVIIYQYRWLLAYFCINSGGQVGEKIAAKFFLKSKREEQIHCLLQNAGQTHFRSNWALCSPWTKNKFDTPSLARQSYIIIIKRFVLKWISLAKWPTLPSSSAVLFLSAGDVNAAHVQRRSLNFICQWKTRLFVWRARTLMSGGETGDTFYTITKRTGRVSRAMKKTKGRQMLWLNNTSSAQLMSIHFSSLITTDWIINR